MYSILLNTAVSVGLLYSFGLVPPGQLYKVAGVVLGEEVARTVIIPMITKKRHPADIADSHEVSRVNPLRQRNNVPMFLPGGQFMVL